MTYQVLSPNPSMQVQQVRLDGNGFKAGMFGSVVVNEALATPAATRGLEVYLKCTEVCRSQTSAELNLTPPAGTLVVADRVTLQSKLGAAALTSFVDWLNGFKAGMFGSVVVNEALATPAATRGLEVYLKCTEVCRSQTSAELNLTPPAGTLVVADRVTLQSKLGAAELTSFVDWLVVCIPCV